MKVDAALLDEVDAVAGPGGRTAWIEEACRARLAVPAGGPTEAHMVEEVDSKPVRRSSEAIASAAVDREKRAERRREQVEPIVKGSKK